MEEVEQLCNHIIILDKGKIIAEGTKEELKTLVNIEEKITVELETGISDRCLEEISNMKHVTEAIVSDKDLSICYSKGTHNLSNLVDYMKDNKIKYNRIFSELPTLNDVFLELTGKELRD